MKFDGFNFDRAKHLAFRTAMEGDVYADGSPVSANHVVFVSFKDCPVVREEERKGRTVIVKDSSGVKKTIPLSGHSLTSMAYGTPRRGSRWGLCRRVVDGRKVNVWAQYWTRPIYLARNGMVYTASVKTYRPNDGEVLAMARAAGWDVNDDAFRDVKVAKGEVDQNFLSRFDAAEFLAVQLGLVSEA